MSGAVNLAEMARLAKLGRRAEERGRALRGCLGALVYSICWALIQAWTFMLGVAVLSAHWWHSVPTIGYWWSLLATVLLRGTLSMVPPRKKATS